MDTYILLQIVITLTLMSTELSNGVTGSLLDNTTKPGKKDETQVASDKSVDNVKKRDMFTVVGGLVVLVLFTSAAIVLVSGKAPCRKRSASRTKPPRATTSNKQELNPTVPDSDVVSFPMTTTTLTTASMDPNTEFTSAFNMFVSSNTDASSTISKGKRGYTTTTIDTSTVTSVAD